MILDNIDLNDVQIEAIKHNDSPSMIIAGAGSGKTRVLTYKIAYLMKEKNIPPYNILALTFTNKAAKEMSNRIEKAVGLETNSLWLGTFHSVFAKILRFEADMLGFSRNFSIYDRDDSKSVIKSIIKELNLDDKIYNPNTVIARISGAKNRLMSAKQYYEDPICQSDDQTAKRPMLGKIFLMYEARCFKADAMDFDDILINTYRLFNQNPEILYKYQEKFKYILVDEFQDTNLIQYNIIKDLSAIHENICIVGDDAQSIYAFRGANIYNMLNFKKDFPKTKIFKLEQNYRSTKNIVNAANSVIKYNENQMPKESWTGNVAGDLIFITSCIDNIDEARKISDSILENHISKHYSYDKFAVLCRTNYQFRSLEEELRKANIPYKIVGGMSFYQRKEIKDMLAYFKFVINHNDEEAFRRIINMPKRGIGPTTVNKIIIAAHDNDMSIWDTLCNAQHILKGKTANIIEDFVEMIKASKIQLEKNNAFETASFIAQRSGLLKELFEDKTINGSSRYENVQELLNAAKNFSENKQEDNSLSDFIQEVSLLTGVDEADQKDDNLPKVTLMTIHSSKGLEFEYVYIAGMEEQLFPSALMINSKEDLEEERRLFYVAITRAKNAVYLSHASKRFKFGKLIDCVPSRFIKEIDPKFIHFQNKSFNFRSKNNFFNNKPFFKKNKIEKTNNIEEDINFEATDPKELKAGDNVEHQKFGKGKIHSITNSQGTIKAKVYFKDFGEKTLLLSFAKLRVIK
ncbi:MAG: UvrD-helicase domain-containing protein [Bacteroidetes bacterium]|nr:UvrD-helicase domain-containing protein [Bacteroidota bacterium]